MGTPKNTVFDGPRGDDDWGIGQMADGSINVMTEEEALKARLRRDAEEALDRMLDGGSGVSNSERDPNEAGTEETANRQPNYGEPKASGG